MIPSLRLKCLRRPSPTSSRVPGSIFANLSGVAVKTHDCGYDQVDGVKDREHDDHRQGDELGFCSICDPQGCHKADSTERRKRQHTRVTT